MDPHIRSKALYSSDGSTPLTDKEAILQRWSEHFEDLFSDRRTLQEYSPAKIPHVDLKLELDDPPTREEIRKATMQLKVGKTPNIDGIPACSISSRICSPTVGRKGLYRGTFGMQSSSLCTKTRGNIILVKLPRHHHILHCRQNLGSHLAEQAHPDDSRTACQKASLGSGPTE